MMFIPSLSGYIARIAENCQQDTSSDPDNWKPQNPTWGHCVMIALLTQELYGGEIWRASLTHIPAFAHMRSHYGNRLPSGAHLDLTAPQFGEEYPQQLEPKLSNRTYVLSHAATLARYAVFRERFNRLAMNVAIGEHMRESMQRAREQIGLPREK